VLDVQKRILEIIEKNLEKEDPDPMIALTVRGVT
jgi:hypothetical protein